MGGKRTWIIIEDISRVYAKTEVSVSSECSLTSALITTNEATSCCLNIEFSSPIKHHPDTLHSHPDHPAVSQTASSACF